MSSLVHRLTYLLSRLADFARELLPILRNHVPHFCQFTLEHDAFLCDSANLGLGPFDSLIQCLLALIQLCFHFRSRLLRTVEHIAERRNAPPAKNGERNPERDAYNNGDKLAPFGDARCYLGRGVNLNSVLVFEVIFDVLRDNPLDILGSRNRPFTEPCSTVGAVVPSRNPFISTL